MCLKRSSTTSHPKQAQIQDGYLADSMGCVDEHRERYHTIRRDRYSNAFSLVAVSSMSVRKNEDRPMAWPAWWVVSAYYWGDVL